MRTVPWLLNTAWMLKCSAEAVLFARASRRVADIQARLLLQTLWANRNTDFGRAHRFVAITDARTYQERVPLATYDDFTEDIRRIAAGEADVLTCEPVLLLEPTSGTTGGEKLIPYTAGLRRQFQRGVAVWIADLFHRRPAVRAGRAYWSLSPMLGPPRRSPGGLPIGFDDDIAYLGWTEQFALLRLLVTPPEVAHLPDMESFRYCTLLFLLAADDLALISVWSPTFLTALLAPLGEWQERLCHDLRCGSLSPRATGRPPDPHSWSVHTAGRPAPLRLAAPGPHQLLGRRGSNRVFTRAARAVPRRRGPTQGTAGHRELRFLSADRPPRHRACAALPLLRIPGMRKRALPSGPRAGPRRTVSSHCDHCGRLVPLSTAR
jgi:hypothetical protein